MNADEAIKEEQRSGLNHGRLIYWVLAAGVWLCALGILLLSWDIWFFMFRV
ncbi:MAG TPA: hypothetical protein VGK80_08105 [Rhodanobacteraceae bacterium]